MADFSHLKTQKKQTIEITVYSDPAKPVLVVRHAGESNKPYYNEILRFGQEMQRRRGKLTTDTLGQLRERDRSLFPKHVVVTWRGVKDKDGKDVPFSVADCEAYLRSLDDDVLDDEVREPCKDRSAFGELSDGAVTAGNSPTV